MSLYSKYVLPRVIDLAMKNPETRRLREAWIPQARGDVLEVGIGSGLLMALGYRWGSSWGAVTLTPYLASLFGGEPAEGLASQMPFLVQLHVFSAFALVAVLPFTRLAPFLIVALDRALALAARPFAAASRGGEAWLRKHNPAVWIWPEED